MLRTSLFISGIKEQPSKLFLSGSSCPVPEGFRVLIGLVVGFPFHPLKIKLLGGDLRTFQVTRFVSCECPFNVKSESELGSGHRHNPLLYIEIPGTSMFRALECPFSGVPSKEARRSRVWNTWIRFSF